MIFLTLKDSLTHSSARLLIIHLFIDPSIVRARLF